MHLDGYSQRRLTQAVQGFERASKRRKRSPKRPRGVGSVAVQSAPSAGGGECGTIEINTTGGIHFRIVCGGEAGPWVSIPSVACNDGLVQLPATPPL